MSHKGEFQSNRDQYKMPDALKQKKDFVYRVGYTSSTGNQTNNEDEPVKRSDL
ncbi:hypothetical protein J7I80_06315 [Bacillus sp. ISL-41]|uniref:hypothetical protein n=1 Tax=Bacillus sp. ISL-41 TaxID=2819127 RepID=UPI001BEC13E9|nr:hypothetical protein [Bacillus sp. ISL-41]MBT2641830.1 hypothetical protein [Bacillus sp. ISL-41]